MQLCDAYNRGEVTGGRSNLPTILITIDINDLNGTTTGSGYTSRGDVIPAETIRRMCANANIVRILLNDSMPLDIGRQGRYATPDQWRALVARDGGCRMHDCTIPPEWCQADHIHEWDAQHGPTNLDLLVLWCIYHHHYRHRPDVTLIGDANNLTIQHPDGRTVPLPPRGPTHQHNKPPTDTTNTSTTANSTSSATANSNPGANTDSSATHDQGTLFGNNAAA